jgi:hypothetical protein
MINHGRLQNLEGESMSKLASERWEEIEQRYTEGAPVSTLARDFNVSRARITRRASKDGWHRQQAGLVPARVPGPRQDGPSGSVTDDVAKRASPLDQRALLSERHQAAWAEVYALRNDAYRILKGERTTLLRDVGADPMQARVSAAEKLIAMFDKSVRALALAQEGERRAHGFDYRQQQEVRAEDEAAVRRRRELAAAIISHVREAYRRASDRPEGAT